MLDDLVPDYPAVLGGFYSGDALRLFPGQLGNLAKPSLCGLRGSEASIATGAARGTRPGFRVLAVLAAIASLAIVLGRLVLVLGSADSPSFSHEITSYRPAAAGGQWPRPRPGRVPGRRLRRTPEPPDPPLAGA